MFSVCPNNSSDSLITGPLVAKKMQADRKIWSAAVNVFALQVVTISTAHHFFPKSSFFYGYTATALAVGFLAIVVVAVSQYIKWKQFQSEEKEKTRTLFGHTFETQKNSKKVTPFKSTTEGDEQEHTLGILPEGVLLDIFSYLNIKELSQLESTCKKINGLLKNENFWKNLILSHFEQVKLPKQDFKKEYRLLHSFKNNIFSTHYLNVSLKVNSFRLINESLYFVSNRTIEDSKGKVLSIDQTTYNPDFHFTDNFIFVTNPRYRSYMPLNSDENWMKVYDKTCVLKFKYLFPYNLSFNSKRPFLQNDKQIFVVMQNSLYCFDQTTGELQKNIQLHDAIHSVFLFHNSIYVSENGNVAVYRQSDLGLEKSNLNSGLHKFWCTASCTSKEYLVSSTSGKIWLFPNKDEKVIELGDLSSKVEQVCAHGEFLFAGDENGNLHVWNIETLTFINQFSLFDGKVSLPMIVGRDFLFAAHSSYYYSLITRVNLKNWEIEPFDTEKTTEKDGAISQMEFAQDKLILLQQGSDNHPLQKLNIYDFGKFH